MNNSQQPSNGITNISTNETTQIANANNEININDGNNGNSIINFLSLIIKGLVHIVTRGTISRVFKLLWILLKNSIYFIVLYINSSNKFYSYFILVLSILYCGLQTEYFETIEEIVNLDFPNNERKLRILNSLGLLKSKSLLIKERFKKIPDVIIYWCVCMNNEINEKYFMKNEEKDEDKEELEDELNDSYEDDELNLNEIEDKDKDKDMRDKRQKLIKLIIKLIIIGFKNILLFFLTLLPNTFLQYIEKINEFEDLIFKLKFKKLEKIENFENEFNLKFDEFGDLHKVEQVNEVNENDEVNDQVNDQAVNENLLNEEINQL
ncbi:unnamed protein product [[Candida] boidinii]|nr:unnamed protein product [[Candida] boidinii]